MFDQALIFLLDVMFSILTYTFLLRFAMQRLRAPFRNPVGQAVTALTNWAVVPLRRVLPGFGGVDWATLVCAWLSQFIWLLAVRSVVGGLAALATIPVIPLVLLTFVELLKAALWMLIVVVFLQAILSWLAPDGPISGLLNALTYRFLAPVRRVVPPLGGTLDLSPLIVIVLAQLVLMLPVAWLQGAVLSMGRNVS